MSLRQFPMWCAVLVHAYGPQNSRDQQLNAVLLPGRELGKRDKLWLRHFDGYAAGLYVDTGEPHALGSLSGIEGRSLDSLD